MPVSVFPSSPRRSGATFLALALIALALAGCQTTKGASRGQRHGALNSRECLARAMYFESNRSSEDGMLAVGTVVMNRYEAKKYGATVCGVVGAKNQFAPGVLSRAMTEPKSHARALKIADEVLKGRRHPKVGKAEFFHTAGYEPGYNNMRYVSIEGGNAFYEKVKKGEDTGNLVRVARRGPSNIGDIIAVNETTMLTAKAVPALPPVEASETPVVMAPAPPPQRTAANYPRPSAPRQAVQPAYQPPAAPAPAPAYEPVPSSFQQTPGPELGWQVGPSGRLY